MKIDSILVEKFNQVTTKSAHDLIERSKTDAEIAVALTTEKTDRGIRIGDYEIVVERHDCSGLKRNYYTILDNEDNSVVYTDIAMFETAMSIVKRLTLGKNTFKCDIVAKLDEEYDRYLLEAYGYKYRLKKNLDTVKRDVYEAKYSNAMAKVKDTRERILKTL